MLLLLMHSHRESHGVKSRESRTCVADSIKDELNICNYDVVLVLSFSSELMLVALYVNNPMLSVLED